jgi:hypothetical protein
LKTKGIIYYLLLLVGFEGFSQNNQVSNRAWNMSDINGEIKMMALYRQRRNTVKDFYDFQKSSYFSGGIALNTKSFIWHPNFIQFDIGGEYSPESDKDKYLVTPDRSEVRTLKGLNMGATLFNSKPVTLNSRVSWNENYSNRENLTNIKTTTQRWGNTLFVRSKYLPVNVTYNTAKWNQTEVQTSRTYKNKQSNLEASTQKSFTPRDNNELSYSHNNYYRQDANLSEVGNISDNLRMNNSLFFDKDQKYSFRSIIYDNNRRGNQSFRIFNATENLVLKLPANLKFTGIYNLYKQQQEFQKSILNKGSANLNHMLFSSFATNLFYEYSQINHTLYHETRYRTGILVNYTKKIPTGQLNLSYNRFILHHVMKNQPVNLQVINEEYILSDSKIITFSRPYIDINTITVKDITGSIIYQKDFDYILIKKGAYFEIQRVPGGQIENNSAVYVDYTVIQEGSYKYDAVSNIINGNIILFNHFLDIYYSGQFIDYNNVEKSDLLILNYIKQNIFGGRINLWSTELGAEYEDHFSTITPYKMMRYFANFQKRIEKITFSVNGNIRDYNMTDESINRQYSDISGGAIYEFSPQTKLDLNIGYRKQKGPGIDLDLLTARTEFKTIYRRLYMTIGVDLYRRKYLIDDTDFKSVYIQVIRKF